MMMMVSQSKRRQKLDPAFITLESYQAVSETSFKSMSFCKIYPHIVKSLHTPYPQSQADRSEAGRVAAKD